MAVNDLELRAILETVLDPKGMDQFNQKLEEAKKRAGGAQERLGALGTSSAASATKLKGFGEAIPNQGMNIFAQNVLAATGANTRLNSSISILSQGIGGLALALPNVGIALGGVALASGILIPLISDMVKESREARDAMNEMKEAASGLKDQLNDLVDVTGENVNPVLERFAALLNVQAKDALLSNRSELDKLIEKQVAEREELIRSIALGERMQTSTFRSARETQGMVAALEENRERLKELSPELEKNIALRFALDQALDRGVSSLGELIALEREEADLRKKAEDESKKESEALKRRQEANAKAQAAVNDQIEREDIRQRERGIDPIAEETEAIRKGAEEQLQIMADSFSEQALFPFEVTEEFEKASKKRLKVLEDEKAAEQETNLFAAQEGISLLTGVFGQSKAASIATALINTFTGATKALEIAGPAGPALAAAVIAFGLAQVAKIRATEPEEGGAGFDLPASDALARRFGERWAADLLSMIDVGFVRALDKIRTPGAGPITNVRTTHFNTGARVENFNVQGMFGATKTDMMKRLRRELIKVDRIEERVALR